MGTLVGSLDEISDGMRLKVAPGILDRAESKETGAPCVTGKTGERETREVGAGMDGGKPQLLIRRGPGQQ